MTVSTEDVDAQQAAERGPFWRAWRDVILSRSATRPPPLDQQREPPADVNYLGQLTEEVRERCLGIIHRADSLATLREDIARVFAEVGRILKDAEETSATLTHCTALLVHEREQHEILKMQHHALREENERRLDESALFQAEIERFGKLILTREERITALEEELSKSRLSGEEIRRELEEERGLRAATSQNLDETLRDLADQEEELSRQLAQITVLNDQVSLADLRVAASENSHLESQASARRLSVSLAESQDTIGSLEQELEACRNELAKLQSRAIDAESNLVSVKVAHQVAESVWRERDQRTAEEIDHLKRAASAENARAEANESQLIAARTELQDLLAKLRMKEREVEHLTGRIAPLEHRIKGMIDEAAGSSERIAQDERSRAVLADRAQAMIRAMSDLKSKLEVSEERAQQYQSRLAAEAVSAAVEREQLQRQIQGLTGSLEKEKAAHLLAAGALSVARGRLGLEWDVNGPFGVLPEPERLDPDQPQEGLSETDTIDSGPIGRRPKLKKSKGREHAQDT
jgi:chromosome segregation ATPase